ncbi:MAG: transglutaminase domain-containing protein [Methylophilaceae bacterium]|uniref:transglutaminase family protein n=1 Tax=Methylovorus sp. MM2 TaxID=1848038 RepID=UPI0007E0F835|nr:transglutaminase family protein [Methylovorus sp. MM2]OAM51617.1 transglutaminase [Methylovorus sp. MM2]
MLLNIEHRTQYIYSEPVNYTIQQLRLTPQDGFGQHVKRWEIRVNGHLQRHADTFGNIVHTLVLDGAHDEITIVAVGEVETGVDSAAHPEDNIPLEFYLRTTPLTQADEAIKTFAAKTVGGAQAIDALKLEKLMKAVIKHVRYKKGTTAIGTTAAEAFEQGAGVGQDQTHVFISCCRSLGLPARYVSGYLFTHDSSLMESHAWVDVCLADTGWISLDVSNACRTNGMHVRLAAGLDYRDACPISGARVGGGDEKMEVNVIVNQMQQSQQ